MSDSLSAPGTQSASVQHFLSADGLPLIRLSGGFGSALFSPQGAHLLEFTPSGQAPLLFLSGKTQLAPHKAIRGGVPVIFPWFGAREGHPGSPMHGLVRTRMWSLEHLNVPETGPAEARFEFASNPDTMAEWPHSFRLSLEFVLGPALEIRWEVKNTGENAFVFEQALHPYFPVRDVHSASVEGLRGVTFVDKTDAFRRKTDTAPSVAFAGETDRLYLNTTSDCVLADPAAGRRLVVSKSGSCASVVWNPWIAKAAALADLGDEEWRGFVCVEQVNALENAVTLPAGGSHWLTARYDFSDPLRP